MAPVGTAYRPPRLNFLKHEDSNTIRGRSFPWCVLQPGCSDSLLLDFWILRLKVGTNVFRWFILEYLSLTTLMLGLIFSPHFLSFSLLFLDFFCDHSVLCMYHTNCDLFPLSFRMTAYWKRLTSATMSRRAVRKQTLLSSSCSKCWGRAPMGRYRIHTVTHWDLNTSNHISSQCQDRALTEGHEISADTTRQISNPPGPKLPAACRLSLGSI